MYTKVYNSITEIDESQWNSIVGRNRIICSYRFLLAVEKSKINDCEYFYPVVYENDIIVAHACAYSISMELDVLAKGIVKKIVNLIRKVWKKFLIIHMVECGTPIALGNTISFAEIIDKSTALSLIIKEIENMAKNKRIGIVLIRDFYDDELSFFDGLIKKGYKRLYSLPNTIIKVKWKSFDEYLNDLKSHYRNEVRKNINIAKGKSLVVEVLDDFSNLAEHLQLLWANVYGQAKEYRREILTKEFFVCMNKYLSDRAKVILFKKNSDVIGFALVLIDDDTLKYMFNGMDYIYNREFAIYFNALYSVIKLGIETNKKEIDTGITTYLPKINVGSKMVNLYMYMLHINALLNPIITSLFNVMTPKIKIKINNVFKESEKNKFASNHPISDN